MIRLEAIGKQFGGESLFEGLSWTIPDRARFGLVGPNGAGKTTLLRILAGRDRPDGGRVHRPRKLQVGYLPQSIETVDGGSVLGVVLRGFAEISALEERLADVSSRMEGLGPGDPESDRLTQEYGELRQRFESLDGDRLETRARAILSGLGVRESRFHESIDALSGGWRMRVVLARLLLATPGLLLLDEPTNHLDLESIAWLEAYLAEFEGALLIVSHDRYFLNRIVSDIAELERGSLTLYAGDYDAYVEAKRLRAEQLSKAAKHQARQIAKTERFIERFRYKNTKARQVQSRVRALGKLERVQETARNAAIRFGFPEPPRSGEIVIRAENVSKRYGDVEVYSDLNLLVRRGERVALIGPNGAGKSTLIKMLIGETPVSGGTLQLGHNVSVHYYSQHQLEALDPEASLIEEAESVADPGERPRVRKLLGSFLFRGDAVDKRVAVLSGGEKARLALAKMLIRPANLLLLDEPTNHLDLPSREVLERALDAYGGTLIVVSHDRYFINRVATHVAAVGRGSVELHSGDYDDYAEWVERRSSAAREPATGSGATIDAEERDRRRQAKREAAEKRNRLYRERQEVRRTLRPLEAEIAKLEERLGRLNALQSTPEVYADPDRAREVAREAKVLTGQLEQLYSEWEAAADGQSS